MQQTVKITRHTSADNKTVLEGDVVTVSERTAKELIAFGAAKLHRAKSARNEQPTTENKE